MWSSRTYGTQKSSASPARSRIPQRENTALPCSWSLESGNGSFKKKESTKIGHKLELVRFLDGENERLALPRNSVTCARCPCFCLNVEISANENSGIRDTSFCWSMSQEWSDVARVFCRREEALTLHIIKYCKQYWLQKPKCFLQERWKSQADIIASQNIRAYHVPVGKCGPWNSWFAHEQTEYAYNNKVNS